MSNPIGNPTSTIIGGKAKGRLIGGNLSVFAALAGSEYLPTGTTGIKWEEKILFLEEVQESPYRIDRYLTTLETAGILDRIAGFVWGTCTKCIPDQPSFSVLEVLQQHIRNCPAFSGLMFGHNGQQFTLPIGVQVEIDADAGTIQMLESALID